ncbi:hypothetical protein, partial [Escherichia coli]|uniref:hypothetical protein n=1 Tax=Escherichia coli TaxID=562 RepID=UPI000CBB970D
SLDFPKTRTIFQSPVLPDYRYEGLNRKSKSVFKNNTYFEIGNTVLRSISKELFAEIEPHLQNVAIKKGQTIFGIGDSIE